MAMRPDYKPDRWVILAVEDDTGERLYKILSGWYGGYLAADKWRLSSGITHMVDHDRYYSVENHSGSVYHCYKANQGLSTYTAEILHGWRDLPIRMVSVSEVLQGLRSED